MTTSAAAVVNPNLLLWKQGCNIAPTRLVILITAGYILFATPGIQIRCFSLKFNTKLSTTSLMELQYADDNALFIRSQQEL